MTVSRRKNHYESLVLSQGVSIAGTTWITNYNIYVWSDILLRPVVTFVAAGFNYVSQ